LHLGIRLAGEGISVLCGSCLKEGNNNNNNSKQQKLFKMSACMYKSAYRPSPFAPVFARFMDDVLGDNPLAGWDNPSTTVRANVREFEDSFEIEVAAPGFAKDAFSVNIADNTLIIKGHAASPDADARAGKTAGEKASEGRYTRREFHTADFERSFSLPKNTTRDGVSARYDNGILTVTVPKHEPEKVVRKVEIA